MGHNAVHNALAERRKEQLYVDVIQHDKQGNIIFDELEQKERASEKWKDLVNRYGINFGDVVEIDDHLARVQELSVSEGNRYFDGQTSNSVSVSDVVEIELYGGSKIENLHCAEIGMSAKEYLKDIKVQLQKEDKHNTGQAYNKGSAFDGELAKRMEQMHVDDIQHDKQGNIIFDEFELKERNSEKWKDLEARYGINFGDVVKIDDYLGTVGRVQELAVSKPYRRDSEDFLREDVSIKLYGGSTNNFDCASAGSSVKEVLEYMKVQPRKLSI